MRWVLPGGAVLNGSNRGLDEQRVACRALAAVLERSSRREAASPGARSVVIQPEMLDRLDQKAGLRVSAPQSVGIQSETMERVSDPTRPKLTERLTTVKLLLEVLAVLVGLIATVLALFGVTRR